ncbi:hypothetical protein [Streptomyces sp. NPDC056401]|uniref:hypothetical protein n=1 Tax=Streptomyces sp. NPDC056401 TaxID=3345809 RepID=UPI0035DE6B82
MAAERQHQQDIAAASADAQAPIPVHLAAKDIRGNLIDAATCAARLLGDPAVRGVRLVVDGLEEPGPIRGADLLSQALSWTTSAAGARWRILATARPGLEVEAELCMTMPELPEDETSALMDRLGGDGSAVHSSPMVRSVLCRPLFAIIGARIQQDLGRLPHTPIAFLDALVTRALRDVGSVKEARAERLVQQLAVACLSGGGLAAAGDVGSPGEIQALLNTRLVVRRGNRHLAFALPMLEQYFAGQALLATGVPDEAMQSMELMDRWRNGLAMAIASGGWEPVRRLLEPLLQSHPGIAAWATHEALPSTAPSREDPMPDLTADVVSRRLQRALDSWMMALGPAGDLAFLHMNGAGSVTVDARLNGSELGLHILHRDGEHTPGLAVPATERWTEPRGVRPLAGWFGSTATDYGGWPWQMTLALLASRLGDLCTHREFDLINCDAYTKERLWLAGADLLGLPTRRFTPLRADEVHQALHKRMYDTSRSLPVRSTFGRRFTGRRAELLRLNEELSSGRWADGQGMLHHPYTIPDQERMPQVEWDWDTYSAENLRLRTEQVLTAAVEIYTALVDTWFPHLKGTLGLASAAPATLIADLSKPPIGGAYDPPLMRMSLQPSPSNSITVRLAASPEDLYAPATPSAAIPRAVKSPWARPASPVISEPEIFDDAPAIRYAYAWLHEDLHRLHLTDDGPRTPSAGLP